MNEASQARALGAGPRIIVGGLQVAPDDPLPSPVVAVSYQALEEARRAASLLLSLQNGSKPFASGPDIYMGDTRVHVGFGPAGTSGQALCEVRSKADPGHWTFGFYAAGRVALEQVKAFNRLLEVAHNYVLTVAHGERVLTQELYLVKYSVEERGVPR